MKDEEVLAEALRQMNEMGKPTGLNKVNDIISLAGMAVLQDIKRDMPQLTPLQRNSIMDVFSTGAMHGVLALLELDAVELGEVRQYFREMEKRILLNG